MAVLNRIAALAKVAAETRGEKDFALWQEWKRSPTDTNLSALLRQIDPIIQKETNKWSGTLARPLLETEGKQLAVEAFKTYDPTRGTGLGTHVTNGLMKMSRLSYANQNVARLPETKRLMYHTFQTGHAELQDALGRAPTTDELADHLGWSIPHLTAFRKQTGHQELLESGGSSVGEGNAGAAFDADNTDYTVDFIHHGLPPTQKAIFEHLTGYGGVKVLSNTEIQKKLNLTQGSYSYAKKKLIDHIEGINGGTK